MSPDLIYDVGMNNGDDTAYYLHKGYNVVAIEANPLLAERAAQRFEREIAAGRLRVLNVGVGPERGVATFWVNDARDEWSAFDRAVAGRDGMACRPVEVEQRPFRDILEEHGVPYYLKIDIECYDVHCLRDLRPGNLPRYLSVEAHALEYLCILHGLGYDAFKCLDQSNHNPPYEAVNNEDAVYRLRRAARAWLKRVKRTVARRVPYAKQAVGLIRGRSNRTGGAAPAIAEQAADGATWIFPYGSSGPFGEETRGPWQSLEEVAYIWLHYKNGQRGRGTLNMDGWYDFHATRREG